jgi:hypothetical protein
MDKSFSDILRIMLIRRSDVMKIPAGEIQRRTLTLRMNVDIPLLSSRGTISVRGFKVFREEI